MKKILLIGLFACGIIQVKAQSFEISAQANGGLSHYVGQSTQSTTFLDAGDPANHTGYPNGDGNRLAFSYGADIQWQYTFKCNFILGVQTGYEVVSSKININGVYDGSNGETPATGYVTDHYYFININPYLGYRFTINKVKLDLLAGIDIAPGAGHHETIDVKASDNTYYNSPTNNYSTASNTDIRLRFGAAAYYQRYGVTASWSRGADLGTTYADSYVPPQHIEIFRLGLSYRIN
jgi:hypothetical protein